MVTPDGAVTPGPAPRVLVVDDEPEIVEILTAVLEAEGHRVDAAADGQQALECVARTRYALILCDMNMPILGGPGVYDALARTHPDLLPRLLFVTGNAVDPAIEAFLARTRAPSLLKPFTLEEVRARTRALLRTLGDTPPDVPPGCGGEGTPRPT